MAMNTSRQPHLPIGYWLKKADDLLTMRINEAQQLHELSRLEWQILNVLHEVGLATHEQLAAPLHAFADAAVLDNALLHVAQRGLIEGNGSVAPHYQLTKLGHELHGAALSSQKEVRQRATQGISEGDYATTVRVLQQLVENLDGAPVHYDRPF